MQEDEELYERVVAAVDKRLSGKRLKHVHSVSETAAHMAEVYGANVFDARIAGLLHDWDKLLTDAELPARMDEMGVERPDHMELIMPVLHSFTGAEAVHREFPELSDEIIEAIRNHTMGSLEMSDLDVIIFVADIIEPGRSAKKSWGIDELRDMVGKVPLDELYFASYQQTMRSLIERRRYIHPDAFDVWNGLVAKHHPVNTSRQGDANIVL